MSSHPFRAIGAALALGAVLGLVSGVLAVRGGGLGGRLRNGPWSTSLVTGSAEAGLYDRARVAVGGFLALDKKETLYFDASVDDAGDRLSGDCTYRIEGRDLATRWWSITAYASDHFLIPNEAGRFSFSKTTAPLGADGRFAFRVSAQSSPGAWLPVKEGEPFGLTLRLYNPAPSVQEAPSDAVLPSIVREGCP